MKKNLAKLNLGCGAFPLEGYLNVDINSLSDADIFHDLNEIPYPFEDNQFEVVETSHTLEHLDKPFSVMKEIHRICKNGATVNVYVPHFSRGFTHAEHNHGFDMTFPYYFDKNFKGGYQGVEFKLDKMQLHWFSQLTFKRIHLNPIMFYAGRFAGLFFDFFANLSPLVCSRLWCYWVGGFEEIYFKFRVVK